VDSLSSRPALSFEKQTISMNDLAFLFFQLEVWNLESPYSVQGRDKRLVGVVRAANVTQILPYLSQDTEDPSPIKPLTFTMFAVIRHRICTSDPRQAKPNHAGSASEAPQEVQRLWVDHNTGGRTSRPAVGRSSL
jgi:hypothetical protein